MPASWSTAPRFTVEAGLAPPRATDELCSSKNGVTGCSTHRALCDEWVLRAQSKEECFETALITNSNYD